MLSVISDVLVLAKIEANELTLLEEDFALAELLETVRAVIGDAAKNKGLTLSIDLAELPTRLRGDASRLTQVLVNFLGNAIKFTTTGGVRLTGRVVEEDAAGFLLRFEVQDTGLGLSEEQCARLFRPFEQIHREDGIRGTGLGLAINRRLAELMGGEVGVQSRLSAGSTFHVNVRLARSQSVVAEADHELSAEEALERTHRGKRVLLAEDEPLNQEIALELLRGVGLELTLARDGAEAVRLAEQQEFAAILMDMRMPVLNGLEATAQIRRMRGREHVPILAMTANVFQEDRARCLAAGMDDFIAKPIEIDCLFTTLKKWLDAGARGRESPLSSASAHASSLTTQTGQVLRRTTRSATLPSK